MLLHGEGRQRWLCNYPYVLKQLINFLKTLLGVISDEGPDPDTVASAYSFVLQKAYTEYTGLKVHGASATLQPPGSDVKITIPDGVHGVLLAHAHTDFQPFREFVPESECFISPVAEVQYIPRDKNHKKKKFTIRIPHDIEDKDAWANIQVRRVDINKLVSSVLFCQNLKPQFFSMFYEFFKTILSLELNIWEIKGSSWWNADRDVTMPHRHLIEACCCWLLHFLFISETAPLLSCLMKIMKSMRILSTSELRAWVSSSVQAVAAPVYVKGKLRPSGLVLYLRLRDQNTVTGCMSAALCII